MREAALAIVGVLGMLAWAIFGIFLDWTGILSILTVAAGCLSIVLFVVLGIRHLRDQARTNRIMRDMPEERRHDLASEMAERDDKARADALHELQTF